MTFATTPKPPYFAVIFSSQLDGSAPGYRELAEKMLALAAAQPGYLGVETVRGADGFGITVSYWATRADIAAWKEHAEHQIAQRLGRTGFYAEFRLRIAVVESESGQRKPG